MNRIYPLIPHQDSVSSVVDADGTNGRDRAPSGRRLIGAAVTLAGSLFISVLALAAPVGGQVASGAGSISQSGSNTNIQQSSQNLSLNWQSFNIAPQETVNFLQPSAIAIAVNRIFDTNGTQILGHLNANGQVYLINPNGILFGQGAQVNVGGFVASTLDMNDASLNGMTRSFGGNGTGSVVNEGTINAAKGGYVALLGNTVSNQGVITAQLGTVALGAGSSTTLTFSGNSLVHMQVDQSTLNNLAENGGLINADGGMVVMTAGAKNALLNSVVNNTGVIEARTVEKHNGTISLLGGMTAGTVNVGGTLDASAPDGGNGGFIETSAAHVEVTNDAKITTAASMGLAGTWLIDPQDFMVAASGGDMTGTALTLALDPITGGNVSIQSSSGGAAGSGNVNINDAVSWSANTLTLTAANNININAVMTASGTASLAMNPATANGGDSAVASGTVLVGLNGSGFTGRVDFSGAGSLSIGGNTYTVINSLGAAGSITGTDLQGINGNLSGYYALGSNIDATTTSSLNSGAGFVPLGNTTTSFTGQFDGLGHTISNLTINTPSTNYIGLFGYADTGSVIRNVGLPNVSVMGSSFTGALVGNNLGSVGNTYATGSVSGDFLVGGLVGNNGGRVSESYATGSVSVSGTGSGVNNSAGGLVGSNGGTVSNSYATASMSGSGSSYIGGLVGENGGTVSNSYAVGSVNITGIGSSYAGGLVGNNGGTVSNSYATGTVSGNNLVGGLVGNNGGTVNSSYWSTAVNATGIDGGSKTGAIGLTNTQMMQLASFSGWNIADTGGSGAAWRIYEGLTTPLLTSFLTSLTLNDIPLTYSGTTQTGASSTLGGVLGTAASGLNTGSYSTGYWSTQQGYDITGGNLTITPANLILGGTRVYDGSSIVAGTVLTATGVNGEIFAVNGAGDPSNLASKNVQKDSMLATLTGLALGTSSNGGLYTNYNTLSTTGSSVTIIKAPLAINAVTDSKIYDSTTSSAGTVVYIGLQTGDTLAGLSQAFASKNVLGAGGSTLNVNGGYVLNDGNGGANYTVTTASASGTIFAKPIMVNGITVDPKVYDGTTNANLNLGAVSFGGIILGDQVSFTPSSVSGSFADKNVGTNKQINLSGVVLSGGDANNYTLNGVAGVTGTITTAPLTVSTSSVSKTYDGGLSALGAAMVTGGTLFSGDSLSGGTFAFTDKNVGSGKTVTTSGVTVGDGVNNSNYNVSYANNTTSTINPANLTVSTSSVSKTYDGGLSALGAAMVTGGTLFSGDSLSGGTFAFTDKNVGSGKTVTTSGVTVGDGVNNSNYNVSYANNTTSTINPANLTVSTSSVSKTYDGGLSALGAAMVTGGTLFSGDSLSGGTFAFTDKNVGSGKTVTTSGVTVGDGVNNSNYNVSYANNTTSTITTAPLTVSTSSVSKTYDGGLSALGAAMVTGGTLFSGDSLSGGTFAFTDKNVGSGKTVTTSGVTVGDGVNNSNYNVSYANNTTSTINPANLTVSTSSVSKTYDGGLSALGAAMVTGGTLFSGDSLSGGTFAFTDKNVGSGKTVTTSGVTVGDGVNNSNYNVSYANNTTSTINPANLTVSTSSVSKTYDGGLSALGAAMVTGGTLFSGDSLSGGTFAFTDKNVGSGKTVTTSGVTVGDGVNNSNYNVSYANNTTSTINPANLTVSTSSVSKTYDGGLSALGAAMVTGGTLFSGDSLSGGTFAFTDKNVGSGKTVTTSGVTVGDGVNNSNYNVSYANNTTSTISPYSVSLTGSRVYDGTISVAAPALTIGPLVGSETLTLSGAGTVANKDVGTAKTVTLGTLILVSGTGQATNYTFSGGTQTVNITKAALAISAASESKTYDGTTSSTGTVTSNGLQTGDTLSGLSQAFTSKNVLGAGLSTLDVNSGYVLNDGNGGANYTVTTYSAAGTITKAALAINAVTDSKIYDGTTSSTGIVTYSGLKTGDTFTGLSQAFASKNVLGVGLSTLDVNSGYTLNDGNGGNNYTVTTQSAAGTITAKAVTLTAPSVSKTYDGGVTYTTTASDLTALAASLVGGDTVTAATISYANKNAGTGNKTVNLNAATISDGNSGTNYIVTRLGNSTSTISPATLNYTATPATFFKGQTISGLSGTVNGFMSGDTLANSTTGILAWTTSANTTSPPGQYAIDGSGLTPSPNYVFAQAARNAIALTMILLPVNPPQPVFETMSQLESDILSIWASLQTGSLSLSPSITVTHSSSSGTSTMSDESRDIRNIGKHGAALDIVDDAVSLPDYAAQPNKTNKKP